MARPRRVRKLNDAKSEVIAENILQENPEGLPKVDHSKVDKIVVAKYIPEYRDITFLNGRDPGYPLDFHYSSKTHPLKLYKLLHGQNYKLPIEIIEHLEGRSEPVYGYRKGLDGHPEMYIVSRKFLFQCRNVPRNGSAAA
jgi:hypothetical protein